MRLRSLAVVTAAAALAAGAPAAAKVFLTQEEALAAAFDPAAMVERRTAFLTDAQAGRIETRSGTELPSRVITYYVGRRPDGAAAHAYFDTHRVRTLPETLLILIGADARVLQVMVLSFQEPTDYLPRDRWYRQFDGRRLEESLALHRDIHGITGATLSGRAVTRAVRRVLAIHEEMVAAAPGVTETDR